MTISQDITGQKFGYLTAIQRTSYNNKHNHIVWTFKCDCGKYKDIEVQSVKYGRTKSCGCRQKELQNINKLKSDKDSSLKSLLWSYKKSAIRRELDFELSLEQFRVITSGNCYYCGCSPKKNFSRKDTISVTPYPYNGIDRVDNSKGYVLGNVVSCCDVCNFMKRTLGYEEFLNQVSSIYNYRIVGE